MKKTMTKRLVSFVLILMFAFVSFIKVEAADKTTNVTKNVVMVGDAVTGSLWTGVNYERMHVQAERLGSILSTDAGLIYSWDAVSVVADNNPAIKVASWGITDQVKQGYKQGTTAAIAKDYEKTHPGYTVLAAINGDFFANASYTTSSGVNMQPTFEPINTWVADGGITLKKAVVEHCHHNVIGIRNDRSYTYHIGSAYDHLGNPVDWVMPESEYYTDLNGNLVTTRSVEGYGQNIPEFTDTLIASIGGVEMKAHIAANGFSETGVNILLPGNYNLDATGYSVYKFNIDRYSKPNDGFQGKTWYGHSITGHSYNLDYTGLYLTGRNMSTITDPHITTVENCFYVITKEDAIKDKIAFKETMTCQYKLTGDVWGDVNSTMGTVIPFFVNGKRTQYVSKSDNYLNDGKPKSVIGFTKDNDAIFFFMGPGPLSGSKEKGPSGIEMAELLERLNVVDAFCLDGGGSATIVARNENGEFVNLNTPTDSAGTRSIGNALLMIIENSNLELKEAKTTQATFHQSAPMADSTLVSAKLHMNNKTYDLENGEVTVNGLKANTKYDYYFSYTYENNGVEYSTQTNVMSFTTPSSDVVGSPENFVVTLDGQKDGSYKSTLKFDANGTVVSSATVSIEDALYELLEEARFEVTELGSITVKYTVNGEEKELVLEEKDYELVINEYVEEGTGGDTTDDPDDNPDDDKPGSTGTAGCAMPFTAVSSFIMAASLMFIIIKKKR